MIRKTMVILGLAAGIVMILTPNSGSLAPTLWLTALLLLILALVLFLLKNRNNSSR